MQETVVIRVAGVSFEMSRLAGVSFREGMGKKPRLNNLRDHLGYQEGPVNQQKKNKAVRKADYGTSLASQTFSRCF